VDDHDASGVPIDLLESAISIADAGRMCVFSVLFQVVADCPIFVLTNRDESTERRTILPQTFTSHTQTRWFGGADARAEGTWFGVNEHGLIAAVTNRKKANVPANPRSRGLLCRDVLSHPTAAEAVDWVQQELAANDYAGFNLIVLTAIASYVIEAADQMLVTRLAPGIYTLGNTAFNSAEDVRVAAMHAFVANMVNEESEWHAFLRRAQQICAMHGEDGSPALCLHSDHWGTVGSTIVALPNNAPQSEYLYSSGPPCTTPYVDYTSSLRAMLTESKRR
jgi:uncharacterized protein with NRDE domain